MPTIFSELDSAKRKDFLDSVRDMTAKGRKRSALNRQKIALEEFSDLVVARINQVYTDAQVRSELMKFADSSFINPLKNVTDRLSVAYKNMPTRTLEGEASEADNLRFQRLLDDGRIGIEAKKWLKWTLICNVIIVVPRILDRGTKRLRWDMYLPSESEVMTAADDPSEVEVLGYLLPDDHVGIIDAQTFSVYDDNNELVTADVHDIGVFPGTVFRLGDPVIDFWSSSKGESLVKATVEISHLMAVMGWVRKGQNRKGLFLAAEDLNKAIAEGQLMLAEKPIEVNALPNDFKFEVHDMETSTKEFENHIRFLYHEVAEQNGLPSFLVDFPSTAAQEPNNGFAAAQQHAKLAEIREDHILFLRYAESELMWKTELMAGRYDHPAALKPSLVRDTFKVVWPPLTFVDDPIRKLDQWKKKIELNVGFSHVDVVMELYPGITREQAQALIKRGIEERKVVADFHAENNLSADANMGTMAQLNGRLGGQMTPTPEPESVT